MELNHLYKKFSDRLKVRAIISVIGLVLTTVTIILFDLLGLFYSNPEVNAFFTVSSRIVVIVDLIFAFLIVNSIKNLKPEAQDIHFTQFHSKFLVGTLINVFFITYLIVAPPVYSGLVNPITMDWENFLIGIALVYAIGYAIGFVANVLTMNAWAHFLRYTKMKQQAPRLIANINLVKFGYLLLTISTLIQFFFQIYQMITVFSSFGLFLEILAWSLYIGNILFVIGAPLLLITGRVQLSKSIKNTKFSSSQEPTLGHISKTQFKQVTENKKYCRNCGTSALPEATFCPNCGNSF